MILDATYKIPLNKTTVPSYLFTDNFIPDKALFANIYNLMDHSNTNNNLLNYFVLNKEKINKNLRKFINKYLAIIIFTEGKYLINTKTKYIKLNKMKKDEVKALIGDRCVEKEPSKEDYQETLNFLYERVILNKNEGKCKNFNDKLNSSQTVGDSLNISNNISINNTNNIKSNIFNGKNIGTVKFELKKEELEKNMPFEMNSIIESKAYLSENKNVII